MEDYSLQRVMEEGHFSEDEILDFCRHLGFQTYEDFQDELIADYMLRVSQIRARMSVSYTHLDVYKRQILDRVMKDLLIRNMKNRIKIVLIISRMLKTFLKKMI